MPHLRWDKPSCADFADFHGLRLASLALGLGVLQPPMGTGADDYNAIAALVYSYAELLDGGDLKAVAQLFSRATVRTEGRPDIRTGSEQVLKAYCDAIALYHGKPCTKHVTTNLAIELGDQGRSARARSYFTVLQARPELPLQVILSGRYHDRFARADEAWGFVERVIFIDLVGDLRFHLRRNPFDG